MTPREVVARALHDRHCPNDEGWHQRNPRHWEMWRGDADTVLAALAADPGVRQRAARALRDNHCESIGCNCNELDAAAALAAALTPGSDDDAE